MWFATYTDPLFDMNCLVPNEQRVARFNDIGMVSYVIDGYDHTPLNLYVSNRIPINPLLVFEMLRARHNPNYTRILNTRLAGHSNLPFENQHRGKSDDSICDLASDLFVIRTLVGLLVWKWNKMSLANIGKDHVLSYNSSLVIYLRYLSTLELPRSSMGIYNLLLLNIPPRYRKFMKKSMDKFNTKIDNKILSYRERLYLLGILRYEESNQESECRIT